MILESYNERNLNTQPKYENKNNGRLVQAYAPTMLLAKV